MKRVVFEGIIFVMTLGMNSRPQPIASDEDLADEPRARRARGGDGPVPKFLALPTGAALAVAGAVLSEVVRLPALTNWQIAVQLGIALLGQICWGAALVIFIIRGNIHASRNISMDGFGRLGFNVVKWGAVTVFLLFDAYVLERVYEHCLLFLF